jgi:alpha-L-rhamnosidase
MSQQHKYPGSKRLINYTISVLMLVLLCFVPSVHAQTWTASSWISYNNGATFPLFRKTFTISKTVSSATAYVCGLGLHEFHINGQKVGNNVQEPLWTAYNKKCFYVTYDVTLLLIQGNNAMGVMLGNGFYNVDAAATGGRYYKYQGTYGPKKMIMQLLINFTDGTSANVMSDATWRVAPSPVTFSSVYGGEDYDARLEQAGWDAPGFTEGSGWVAAMVCQGPGGALTAQYGQPIQVRKVWTAGKPTALTGGAYEYNLTQNIAGVPVITIRGKAGQTVKLSFREYLSSYTWQSNATTYCQYTLKGSGAEVWSPRFFYYGFQYVKVEGASTDTLQTALPAILSVLGNEQNCVTRTGSFSCSDTLWNKIHYIIDKAIEGNMQASATDCPHREKLGWLEESHLIGPSIMYNYEVSEFYRKIFDDMKEAQLSNGMVPDIAPEFTVFSGGFRDSPEWGSAIVIGPWLAYQFYGDVNVLQDHYDAMKAYVNYLTSKASGNLLNYGLCDWYGIDLTVPGMIQLVPSSIYYYDVTVMQQAASLLGKTADATTWATLAANIKTAFNNALFNAGTATYATGNQTACGMPLALGLVPDNNKAAVLAKLVARVQADGYRMQVGEIGFRFVLKALSDNNRSDVIAQIASQTTSPSFGYLANSGRTTLSEAMDGNPASSQFHMMYGHIEEWFYYAALGIAPNTPGFAEVRFRPEVAGTLKSAAGYVQTKNGRASSSWTYANKIFDQDITIPAGGTGLVYLPSVGSGIDSAMVYAGTTVIWRNRAIAGSAAGVTYDTTESNYFVWHAAAGTYHFRLGPPNTPPPAVDAVPAVAGGKSPRFTLACMKAKQYVDITEVRSVRIFDLAGRTVRELAVAPHVREVSWDGRNAAGEPVPAGIYLVWLRGNGASAATWIDLYR